MALTNQQKRAAGLVADGTFHRAEIAKAIGVDRSTLARWSKDADFIALVDQLRPEPAEQASTDDADDGDEPVVIERALKRALVKAESTGEPRDVAAIASSLSQHLQRSGGQGQDLGRALADLDATAIGRLVSQLDTRTFALLADATNARDVALQGHDADTDDQRLVWLFTGTPLPPAAASHWATTWRTTIAVMASFADALARREAHKNAACALGDEPDDAAVLMPVVAAVTDAAAALLHEIENSNPPADASALRN